MPSNPYTSVSISGYNSSPPPDDGSQSSANQVEWSKHINKIGDPLKTLAEGIDANVLAAFSALVMTTNPAEDLVFILTPKAVVIYSTAERAVLDRIPVDASFDRIAYQNDDRLVLTATEPSRISIIRFSRIYDIDLSGRAVKGPPEAKVTLVVFDDYQ